MFLSEKALNRMVMKRRMYHMNPPMPKLVCEKDIQNAELDESEVIIKFMMDAQCNRIRSWGLFY